MSEHRSRSYTKKGRLYQLGVLQNKRKYQEKKIRKELSRMESRFYEDKLGELRAKLDNLNKEFEDYMETHAKCQILMQPEDKDFDNSGIDQLDKAVFNFRRRAKSWLSELERSRSESVRKETKASSPCSRTSSKSSKSTHSSKSSGRSSGSTIRSIELKVKEEKARIAELQIEASFLKRQQETELAAKQLENELNLAKATAKLKVFEREEEKTSEKSDVLENLAVRSSKETVNEYLSSMRDTTCSKIQTENEEEEEEESIVRPRTQRQEDQALAGTQNQFEREQRKEISQMLRQGEKQRVEIARLLQEEEEQRNEIARLLQEEEALVSAIDKTEEKESITVRTEKEEEKTNRSIEKEKEEVETNSRLKEKEERTDLLKRKESEERSSDRPDRVDKEGSSGRTDKVIDLLRYLQAPEVDIDVFNGDPLEFLYFMSLFCENVETKIDNPKGRLTRLLKYLDGEAKELVKGCIYLPGKQ